ncbi:Uncharacterized protein Fot_22942 [Forsythia ovata]|uniref:Uncharacterized protein n=1 Tax=Forsythia ovata TaxID=205694 RepID=A0ABD1UZ54_9LAMI
MKKSPRMRNMTTLVLTVPVRLSRAQKGKQKVDERLKIADLPTEHQNIGNPSSDVLALATHPQLFEQSLLRKDERPCPRLWPSVQVDWLQEEELRWFDFAGL